jgi:hypothetical protein
MLTPIDKLKSGKNDIIQIIVTTKCSIFTCSNCTQLLPFRKDSREMSLECLEKALECTAGWPGVIALFGGNPASASQFPEMCRLVQKHIPKRHQRGLWCNDLLEHGEIAAETFTGGRSNFNVHGDAAAAEKFRKFFPDYPVYGEVGRDHHGAILQDYRDYGISEGEFAEKREQCNINQNWSAAIRQSAGGDPHVYFCEVAASIDGMLGNDNGIPAYPDWWKTPISEFSGQVANCCGAGCGVPLRLQGHGDREDIYDVSPSWKSRIEDRKWPVGIEGHDSLQPQVHELTDYIGLRLKKDHK